MSTLLQHHADRIAASGISADVAEARGYRSITDPADATALGFKDYQARVPALLMPVHGVEGGIVLHQLRPDAPRIKGAKPIRYETPAGSRMTLDVPPAVLPVLGDASVPLIFTEGIKKADAIVSAGGYAIDLLGVFNFSGTDENGEKVDLPEFNRINLAQRVTDIAYDSDVMTNPLVKAALTRLTALLRRRGAIVRHIFLPAAGDGGKQGVDDYLAAGHTMEDLSALARDAPPVKHDAAILACGWDRFKARAVDLADVIENGLEPVELFDTDEPDVLTGCVTCIFGGPEQGKTLIAAHKTLRALQSGKRVLLIDEEMGIRLTAERLDAMGATRTDLARLIYLPFTLADFGGNLDTMAATILEGILTEQIDLIVLDSISKLFVAAGIEENDNTGATKLLGAWITPAAHVHGRTVLLLDHTSKAEDDGKYGRGASSKLADVDVQWHIQAAVRPTREILGRLVLTRKKDRLSSVPTTVNYLAGGDGTGGLNVRIEGSDDTASSRMRESDRTTLVALHGERNIPLRFSEWLTASKRTKGTFTGSRKRLVAAHLVEQCGDFYHVSVSGIAAINDDLAIIAAVPKQGPLTSSDTLDSAQEAIRKPDVYLASQNIPVETGNSGAADAPGVHAAKRDESLHGVENERSIQRYVTGMQIPEKTSQNGRAGIGMRGLHPLRVQTSHTTSPDASNSLNKGIAIERDTAAVERLWQWWADVNGGKVHTVSEQVRQAAQQVGLILDGFAPIQQEADRLGAHLDAREEAR